jgi:tetrahydromethanopterin S-methyltransferase subunit A
MKNVNLDFWPKVDGRYKVGNKRSPIAICTNASIDEFELDMNKIAIIGKCVTENIGIEKIIENIITNPYIRFLILCGKEAKGHFVTNAFISLKQNGVDESKRIIGAKGNMPFLKNLNKEQIEHFRNQVEIIALENERDSSKIIEKVNEYSKKPVRIFDRKVVKSDIKEEIAKKHENFIEDTNGYFLISIDKKNKKIIAEHVKDGKINVRIIGNNNEEIRDTIERLNLIKNFERTIEHAMCIGRELYKAELALKHDLEYVQDSDLKIDTRAETNITKDNLKENKDNKKEKQEDEYGWFD